MARTAGDAALDFEMKMLLETKEAEASAARLEGALDKVLKIFGAIGKAATTSVGMITAAIKAPADLDNYLGSLNTKITNINGALIGYRETLLKLQGMNKTPGSALYGFSIEDHQKTMMGFARGAAETEKYGAGMQRNLLGYAQGVGQISKGIGTSIEETTGIVTSFHRELGISYSHMDRFGKQLANIGRQSGMTADQTKALYRTVTSLGRAYGLTGKNAEKFVLESVAVGAAISKIGLDANQILRQMNEVATGSEEGLIQSLLLGFKPSDPVGQLKAFQEQAKMITQMADQAGEQFAPFLTRRIGDKLGLKNFSVEQIQAMARGESVETGTGETVQQDMLTVLKGIRNTMDNQARAAENPYATFGQGLQEAITQFITFMQKTFTPAMLQLKNMIQHYIPQIAGTLERWKARVEEWIGKIQNLFGTDKSPLTTLAMGAAAAALALTLVPTVIGMVLKSLASRALSGLFGAGARAGGSSAVDAGAGFLGGALGRMLPTANPAAAQAAALGVEYTGATGMATSLAVASAGAIALTIVGGAIGGLIIGRILDKLWENKSKFAFFDKIASPFTGQDPDEYNAQNALDKKYIELSKAEAKKPQDKRRSAEELKKLVYGSPKIVSGTVSAHAPTIKWADSPQDLAAFAKKIEKEKSPEKIADMPSSEGGNFFDNYMMSPATAVAEQFKLKRTDKPGSEHSPGSAHYLGMAQDYSIKGMSEEQIKSAVAALNATGLYEAIDEDESKKPKNLSKEAQAKWARHIHVELKDELRNSVLTAGGASPLSNFGGMGSELAVKDTESHNLLREIAAKLGIVSNNTAASAPSESYGTPISDAHIAALTPLHVGPWDTMQLRSTKIMASGG